MTASTLAPHFVSDARAQILFSYLRATSGQTHHTSSPIDGSPLAAIPQSSDADVAASFEAARVAQSGWAASEPEARGQLLLRLHDLLLDQHEALCDIICAETGKARKDAHEEVLHTAMTARYYARTAARHLRRERRLGALPLLTQVEVNHVPKGVVAVISPWNYPLTMALSDGIAALAAGNAVIIKPDAQTMLTALFGTELLYRAGLPAELWQVVAGRGDQIGPALIERADYVCFTGSTKTGRGVAALAGQNLVGASLELGGKNPMVVLADADLDAAVEGAIRGCFSNAGQLCVSFERLYIAREVFLAFADRLVARVEALDRSVGLGWGGEVGTLASQAQLDKVSAHVEDARTKGATVLAGGRPRPDLAPFAYEPTVLVGVTPTMDAFAHETFGPVVALYPFDTDDEAVDLANAGPEGLNASVWSRDIRRATGIARRIACGTVNVNEAIAATFGSLDVPMGGFGVSGLGRRQGREGILRFTQPQGVGVQRGLALGAPAGMSQEKFATMMRQGLRLLRRLPRP